MKFQHHVAIISIIILCNACATFKPQYKYDTTYNIPNKDIAHSFYVIGNAGNSPLGTSPEILKIFTDTIAKASAQSTVIFLGDNSSPEGLPKEEAVGRSLAAHQLNIQIDAVKDFKGRTIVIPGNEDWYNQGLEGLKRQETYIENALGKHTFLPENGCPIEKVVISEKIDLIIIDTEWYLTNWDKHPNINEHCDIKTKARFFDVLEDEVKKSIGKTTLIALHHPIFTNGSHGGQFPFNSNFKPFPLLGTLKNIIRKAGGVSTTDIQNKLYRELRKHIVTLSQNNEKTIFISGHERNLQYIIQENLPQIVSGSGSTYIEARNVGGGEFASASQGFARLDVFKDGSSYVRFYSKDELLYTTQIFPEDDKPVETFSETFPKKKITSIYTKEETNKSGLYKWVMGDRYREDYSTAITASTVSLDTLYGGLTAVKKGGGHQSRSLLLKDKAGGEYVMQALRKNALQYLQAVAFKDQYVEGQFDNTSTEELLQDIFTGTHPYAPFIVSKLAEAVGVAHTNPKLYYIPKQEALGRFNSSFGDELYRIEESFTSQYDNHTNLESSSKLITTSEVLGNIVIDEAHKLDEAAYIKARLFDMLIGDWDRHEDQWRWATVKKDEKTMYRPIPVARDQAFSAMTDGLFLNMATQLVSAVQLMKSYDDDIKHPERFNAQSYHLDIALINHTSKTVWDSQIKQIITNLTEAKIDDAFSNLPKEINQETTLELKEKLKGRLENLERIADDYYNFIQKHTLVRGTNKSDWIEVERQPNGKTRVSIYRNKDGNKADKILDHTYSYENTKDIWIYGLDGDDRFHVFSEGNKPINVSLIGGHDKDIYDISNGKKIKIYDYKSEDNVFLTKKGAARLTDDYETNSFNYKKIKKSSNAILPLVGADPDNGLKLGLAYTYTNYGVDRNPFSAQHSLSGGYYYATDGFDLEYYGERANIFGKVNFSLKVNYTSPDYAVNFFGYGNNTPNPEADNEGLDVNFDYNRVKLQSIAFYPSLIWRGQQGSTLQVGLSYESYQVDQVSGRFVVNEFITQDSDLSNNFYGVNGKYQFQNIDNNAFPTLGMLVNLEGGYKGNTFNHKGFAYLIPEFGFVYKLTTNKTLVLASKIKGHFNFGYNFEFYQAAYLGANSGLRAYRNNRFSGRNSVVHITDLRVNLSEVKTKFLPLNIGFFVGADYGRVWVKPSLLLDPSYDSKRWNTSLGGGVFASALDILSLNVSTFIAFAGLGFRMGLVFVF